MRAQSLAAELYSSMRSSLQPASCRPLMMLSFMSSLCDFDFGSAGKRLFTGTGLGTNERVRLIELFEELDLGGESVMSSAATASSTRSGLEQPTMGASTPRAQCHASAICAIGTS